MSLTHWQPNFLSDPSWKSDDGPFFRLWNDWWNNKERGAQLVAGEVIDLDSLAYSDLYNTRGRLFIRDYHARVYDSLQHVDEWRRGVVLTGQPGTGKTCTLYFLLLKKLVDGEPVLFIPSKSYTLYFSSGGVQSNSDITPSDINELNQGSLPRRARRQASSLTWALVNTDYGDGLPPPSGVLQGPLFVVQATAPGPSRYKSWVSRQRGTVWCVPRWTREELVKTLALVPYLSRSSIEELESSINEVILKWGWAPRDVERALSPESPLEQELSDTLWPMTTLDGLVTRFHNAKINADDDVAYTIAGVYESRSKKNKCFADFKSPYVRHRVQMAFDRAKRGEMRRLIEYCQENSESTLVAGWTFDNHVIHTLCNADDTPELYPPMPASCTSGSSWSSVRTSPFSASLTSGPSSSIGRTRTRFDTTLKNVTLDDTKLFLPYQFNFPLLDAFYLLLDRRTRHVKVVVLQMTIYATHKASTKGYTFLERLKEHLQSQDTTEHDLMGKTKTRPWKVSFAYHLIVPSSLDHQFTWNLPGKFPESISGPVYTQGVLWMLPPLSGEEDESSFAEDSTAAIHHYY